MSDQDTRGASKGPFRFRWTLWVLAAVMAVNLVLVARSMQLLSLPGELDDVEIARRGAYALVDYYGNQATERQLDKNQAVRDTLARFRYEVAQAVTLQEIGSVLSRYGTNIATVLDREQEDRARKELADLVSQAPELNKVERPTRVVIRPNETGRVLIEDPAGVLAEETKRKIAEDPRTKLLTGIMELDIADGKAAVVTTRSLEGELQVLRQENQQMKAALDALLQSSGYAPMTGPGLIIRGSLKEDSVEDVEGTLGYDIRDIINELFAAGANGVEVGGQRLIATSSIRTIAGRLLVNQKPVTISPLSIKAVGDPKVLETGLDLIRNAPFFSLNLVVSSQEKVTLSAYQRPQ